MMGPRMGVSETLPPPAESPVDRPVLDCGVMARRIVIVGGGLMGLRAAVHHRRGGGLRLALDDAAWRAAPAWVAEQRADGVPVERVDADAARGLAPGVAPACRGGVHCAIDGQADAMATVRAFA